MSDIEVMDFDDMDPSELIRQRMNQVDPIDSGKSSQPIVFTVDEAGLTHPHQISRETIDVITSTYKDYNKRYGLNLNVDISTISSNFKDIIDPKNKKIFEIYLSESFERFRLTVFQKMMVQISTLLEQVSVDSAGVTVQDKFIMIEKLFQYMDMCNTIYEKVKVEFGETELMRIASEQDDNSREMLTYNDPDVKAAIEKLSNTILNEKESNE